MKHFKLELYSRKVFAMVAFLALMTGSHLGRADDAAPEGGSPPPLRSNEHWVGWVNTLLPGGGQAMLGNYGRAGAQAALEVSTFSLGYHLSNDNVLTLDGFSTRLPSGVRGRRNSPIEVSRSLYGDLLQEVGLKAHMVNVFDAYREAAAQGKPLPSDMESETAWQLFLKPFDWDTVKDPWVYLPLGVVLAFVVTDYWVQTSGDLEPTARLTPASNSVFAFNYGIWQPLGSGAPEEMFYRGFLQREVYHLTSTPWLAIPASTAAFAMSHAPGSSRYTAAVGGLYLGYLTYHLGGRLGPGIALHFWGGVLLGLETILLNHSAQRTTPPTGFGIQLNF